MAERWAVATGNWSSTATWNGGTLPTAADDVYANGFTVTINQDVTVLSLRNTSGATAVAGGSFTQNASTIVTLTGSGVVPGTNNCVVFSAASPSTATLNGNVSGSLTTAGCVGVNISSTGTYTINGQVTGGALAADYGVWVPSGGVVIINNGTNDAVIGGGNATAYGLFTQSTSRFSITGNCVAGSAARAVLSGGTATGNTVVGNLVGQNGNRAIEMNGIGSSLTITGNIRNLANSNYALAAIGNNETVTINGNLEQNVGPCLLSAATGMTVIINGNVIGCTTANMFCISTNASTSGSITVTGSVTGGTNSSSHGINILSSGWTVTVNGTVTGGSGSSAAGIFNGFVSTVTINGNAVGSTGGVGVNNTSTGTVTITGSAIGSATTGGVGVNNASTGVVTIGNAEFGAEGWPPYGGRILFSNLTTARVTIEDTSLAARTLISGAFVRYPLANGSWSTLANWDYGITLPQPNDEVHADGKSITIDQDVTVVSLNTTQRIGGINAGVFNLTTSRIINANILAGGNSCIILGSGTFTSVINGNIQGGLSGTSATIGVYLSTTGVGNLTINGNVTAGNASNCHGIRVDGNSNILTVNGNVTGGSGAGNCYGISLTANSSITVVGTISGGSGTNGIGFSAGGTGTVLITGNINGGSGSQAHGFYPYGNKTVTITGNVTAGSGSHSCGVYTVIGLPVVTLNGNVIGGTNSTCYGLAHVASSTFTINGNVTGGSHSTAYGVHNSSSASGIVNINGISIASNETSAINNESSAGYISTLRAQHAANGRTPWTGNGKIFFGPLGTTNLTINNSSGTQRMLGRVGG